VAVHAKGLHLQYIHAFMQNGHRDCFGAFNTTSAAPARPDASRRCRRPPRPLEMRDTDLTRLSATLPTPRALLPNDSELGTFEVRSVRNNSDTEARGTGFDWEFEYRRQARAGHRYEHPADARPATPPSTSLRPATSPSPFPYTPAPDPSMDPKWNSVRHPTFPQHPVYETQPPHATSRCQSLSLTGTAALQP